MMLICWHFAYTWAVNPFLKCENAVAEIKLFLFSNESPILQLNNHLWLKCNLYMWNTLLNLLKYTDNMRINQNVISSFDGNK